jgi:hypothetical protein
VEGERLKEKGERVKIEVGKVRRWEGETGRES